MTLRSRAKRAAEIVAPLAPTTARVPARPAGVHTTRLPTDAFANLSARRASRRLLGLELLPRRPAQATAEVAETPPWPAPRQGGLDLSRPLDLSRRAGIAVVAGDGDVVNMTVNLREVTTSVGVALEARFELMPRCADRVIDRLLDLDARLDRWCGHAGDGSGAVDELSFGLRQTSFAVGFHPAHLSCQALRGKITLHGFGATESARRQSLGAALDALGLTAALARGSRQAQEVAAAHRLLWQVAPRRQRSLARLWLDPAGSEPRLALHRRTAPIDLLRQALVEAGLPRTAAAQARVAEVFPGYSTFVSADLAPAYRAAGVSHLRHHTADVGSVVAVLLGDGLLSHVERLRRGVRPRLGPTQWVNLDAATGGADYVFVYPESPTSVSYTPHVGYSFVLHPRLLLRTDWFGHGGDCMGSTELAERGPPLSERLSRRVGLSKGFRQSPTHFAGNFERRLDTRKLLAESMAAGASPELMFRTGISKADIVGVVASTAADRRHLLSLLKRQGLTEIHGVAIERFVSVADEFRATLASRDFFREPLPGG